MSAARDAVPSLETHQQPPGVASKSRNAAVTSLPTPSAVVEDGRKAEFDLFDEVSLGDGAMIGDGGVQINGHVVSVEPGVDGKGRRLQSSLDDADGDETVDEACGCLGFHPEFGKRFRTPAWMLFCFCLASFIQGMVVNGLVNVIISTVEKRFQLSSTESGLIASFYDIGYFFCAIPVTYFGGRSHASKPKWVSAGVLFMAAGFFVFCLPHFTTSEYAVVRTRDLHDSTLSNSSSSPLCSSSKPPKECLPPEESLASYKWVFYLAQFLIGIGATPLYTLAVTYVDENVAAKLSSLYLGVFYAMASVGPAVGYVVGGQTLEIFTDFSTVDAHRYGLTPENNLWVGAWWLGFLGAAIFGMLIFLPISALPRSLPGGKAIRATRKRETHQSNVQLTRWLETKASSDGVDAKESSVTRIHFRELTMALVRLVIGNPTFLFLTLAGAAEGFLLAGFATFLPKYFENQFRLTAGFAAMIVGVVAVPGAGGGTLLGGYLIKKYDMKLPAILRLCCVSTFLAGLASLVFIFHCGDVEIAGVTTQYKPSNILPGGDSSPGPVERALGLTHGCNAHCECDLAEYDPMCGSDGLLYYSPCFAGCTDARRSQENVMKFSLCSCVTARTNSSILLGSGLGKNCPSDCSYLPMAVVFLLLIMVMTFITSMPSLTATLRCVEEEDRSIALGVQLAVLRVLGTIPAPVLFGKLMDLACSLWETIPGPDAGCDSRGTDPISGADPSDTQLGSCRAYYNYYMSTYLLNVALIGKAIELLCFYMAWRMYRAPSQNPATSLESDSHVQMSSSKAKRKSRKSGESDVSDRGSSNRDVQQAGLSSRSSAGIQAYDNPVPVECT